MKTKFRLLLMSVFVVIITTSLQATTAVPDTLFISEFRADANATAIIELYNGDSDTIWLSNFNVVNKLTKDDKAAETLTFGDDEYLLPGECYTILSDKNISYTPNAVYAHIDTVHNVADNLRNGNNYVDLEYINVADGEENIIIDRMLLAASGHTDVNSVTNGSKTCLCIRKFSVKEGNPSFLASAPLEWLTMDLPNNDPWRDGIGFSTLYSNHANNSITTNPNPGITIDHAGATITVPYGIWRQDYLVEELNPGPGMAWEYYIYGDTSSIVAQTGDKIALFAFGDTMEVIEYDITVLPPADDYAGLAPYGEQIYSEELDEWAYYFADAAKEWPVMDGELASYRYNVTDFSDGTPDTIGNVIPKRVNSNYTDYIPRTIPFAERVDTLIKYLDIPEGCTYDFTWVGGEERVDVKHGDILNIISKDGNYTRQYFLNVAEYEAENIATLSNVTWPDIQGSVIYYINQGWNDDTIPSFSSSQKSYTLNIDHTTVPALCFEMTSNKSTMTVDRAFDLTGSVDKRTTTVTVTAEDGVTVSEYKFIFKIVSTTLDEPFIVDPIITQHTCKQNNVNAALEISNPGNRDLDLANYMIVSQVQGVSTERNVISAVRKGGYYNAGYNGLYVKYIPGCKWDTAVAYVDAGIHHAIDDNGAVKTILPPGGSFLFVATETRSTDKGAWAKFPDEVMAHPNLIELPSVHSPEPNAWGEKGWGEGATNTGGVCRINKGSIMLFRIENDSVISGEKDAMNPDDFTLVDWVGPSSFNGLWIFEAGSDANPNRVAIGANLNNKATTIIRKPHVYKGITAGVTTTTNPGFGSDTTESEWEWYGSHLDENYYNYVPTLPSGNVVKAPIFSDDLGKHTFDAITIYQSVIGAKESYVISNGYGLGQSIDGVLTGTTAAQFFAKIDTLDAGQTMTLYNAGTISTDANYVLQDADSLVVLSADGNNSTTYSISVTTEGLDSNTDLVSSNATIVVDKAAQTVTIEKLTETATMYNDLSTVSATSRFYVMQGTANAPTKAIGPDTTYVNTLITPEMSIDIIAQNGTTATYAIIINGEASDAYVTSQVYSVTEDNKNIAGVATEISVANLLDQVYGAPGATVTVVDNMFFDRPYGTIRIDDQIKVVAEDGTTVFYHITMIGEDDPGASALDPIKEISNEYSLYPNPTDGTFYISGELSNSVVTVFSSKGAMINRMIKPTSNEINLSSMQSGIYFVVISGIDGGQETHKLIKE